MNGHMKAAALGGLAGGLVVALAFLLLGSGALSGRDFTPVAAVTAASQEQLSHEDMHRMMDAVHGEGTSQRMHEAMGPNAEETMDRCAAMMAMVQEMQSMMGGQNGDAMRDMKRHMMEQ